MFPKRLTLFFLFSLALHLSLLLFLVLWTRGWFSRQPLGGGVGGSMLLVKLGGGGLGPQGSGQAEREEGEKRKEEEETKIIKAPPKTEKPPPVLKKEALVPEKKSEKPMASIPPEPSKQEGSQKGSDLRGAEGGAKGVGGAPGQGAGEPGEGGGEGGGKGGASILAEIRRKIERNKHYPEIASRRNIEGTVTLYFRIEENGAVRDLHLVKSSGSSILDEEALATVRRSVPFPYYSKPLTIPLEFSQED